MLVKICGFKCHLDSTFKFTNEETPLDSNVVLLSGKSGQGKTTILQAISWALYGGMRGIYNNTVPNGSLGVTIVYRDMKIYRQKRPELLQVSIEDRVYEDQVAQEIINEKFGTKEIWYACCFIQQKERCGLLSVSNVDRMDILNRLSFQADDPRFYIDKISERLKTLSQKHEIEKTKLGVNLDLFNKQLETRPPIDCKNLSLDNLNLSLNKLETLRIALEKDVYQYHRNKGTYDQLVQQVLTLEKKLSFLEQQEQIDFNDIECLDVCKSLEEKLSTFPNLLTNARKQKTLLSKISDIEQKLSTISPDLLDPRPIVTKEEIWQVEQDEKTRAKYIQNCKQQSLEYNKEAIDDEVKKIKSEYEKTVDCEKKMPSFKQYLGLVSEYEKFKYRDLDGEQLIHLLDTLNDEINHLTESLHVAKTSLDLHLCPHCQGALRIKNNGIVRGDGVPSCQEDIKLIETKLVSKRSEKMSIENALKICEKINILLEHMCIDEMETFMKKRVNKSLKEKLLILEKIVYVAEPVLSSAILKRYYEEEELKKLLLVHQNSLAVYSEEIEESSLLEEERQIKIKLDQQRKLYQEMMRIRDQRKEYKSMYEKAKSELGGLTLDESCVEKLEKIKEELMRVKKEIEEVKYAMGVRQERKELMRWRERVVVAGEDLLALEKLRVVATQVECEQLEDTVEMINMVMVGILEKLFQDPITVNLSLFKQLKSQKSKMSVNIQILYKGCEYDSVNQMSGGEGDRVSLALAVALNSVTSCPLLLLDECMTAFDPTLKEVAVTMLKGYAAGKIVICVDHGATEGFYDKVLMV